LEQVIVRTVPGVLEFIKTLFTVLPVLTVKVPVIVIFPAKEQVFVFTAVPDIVKFEMVPPEGDIIGVPPPLRTKDRPFVFAPASTTEFAEAMLAVSVATAVFELNVRLPTPLAPHAVVVELSEIAELPRVIVRVKLLPILKDEAVIAKLPELKIPLLTVIVPLQVCASDKM